MKDSRATDHRWEHEYLIKHEITCDILKRVIWSQGQRDKFSKPKEQLERKKSLLFILLTTENTNEVHGVQ